MLDGYARMQAQLRKAYLMLVFMSALFGGVVMRTGFLMASHDWRWHGSAMAGGVSLLAMIYVWQQIQGMTRCITSVLQIIMRALGAG